MKCSRLVCIVIGLWLPQVHANDCKDLFVSIKELNYIGLAPEKVTEVWNRGDKEKRYLQAGAQMTLLLKTSPRHFYRALSILTAFANIKSRPPLPSNPLVRALKTSEIQARWHQAGLDVAAELIRRTAPSWYAQFLDHPSLEFKDLLSHAASDMKSVNPALLSGAPDPQESQVALEIMMRQLGVDFERVQSLLDHSRTFRNLFAIDGGDQFFQKFHNRPPSATELYLFKRLLDHMLDRVQPPHIPEESQQAAQAFQQTFMLDRKNRFPTVGIEAVMSAMIHLKTKFLEEVGLPLHKHQVVINEPHALSWNLLRFLDEDQIGGADQLFFQFACLFTQIIPASWPARTEMEAVLLKSLTEQMHSF